MLVPLCSLFASDAMQQRERWKRLQPLGAGARLDRILINKRPNIKYRGNGFAKSEATLAQRLKTCSSNRDHPSSGRERGLGMCGGRRPAFRRTSPSRCLSAAVVLAVLGTSAVEGVPIPLPLTLPGRPGIDGKLDGPGAVVCYNFTLSDEAVREVVWWEKGRLALRLEPCVGKPHLRASVYG